MGVQMSRRAVAGNLVALVVVVALASAFLWLMSSLPRTEGSVQVDGLEMPATVARDRLGIPRIKARSAHDAYFTLGWVHAQDRMWQMELQRRIAAGRLAEIFGAKALASDRFMRTLGLRRRAEASVARLDGASRDALAAYAAGINSWIADNGLRLPLEYRLVGLRPEPWAPADSLAWGRLMGLQLAGNWKDDVLRGKLLGKLGPQLLDELFPGSAADAPITVASLPPALADSVLAALPEAAEPRLASNVWVVDGKHTRSGKPLLANDPHLAFQAPILWYLARVEAPDLLVAGATVPGIPFHLIGHNARIAWGLTATHADTVDLFVEKLSADGAAYAVPGGSRPLGVRSEVIKVKGGADEVLTVRETRHGPVISDLAAKGLAGDGEVVAMRATALEPDDLTAQAFLRINRASDWNGFVAALKDFASPVQNVAFADTSGTIGFITAGRVPIRRGGDGSLPAEGWTGEGDWVGWIPFGRMPRLVNPRSGIIVNANNPVTGPDYPYEITASWPDGYRARRILDLLAGRNGLAADDMAAIQTDTLSLAAIELKALVAGAEPATPLGREAAGMVAAWDGHADRDRPEPLIFNAWIGRLWHDLLAPTLGEDAAAFGAVRPAVLAGILTGHHHWCGDQGCERLAGASLDSAVADLARRYGADPRAWRWGAAHRAVFTNPVLAALPLPERLAAPAIATDGDDFTVNRGSFAPDTFTHLHGAGLRAIFDLAAPDDSGFVIATGQSGNALSRHFTDQIKAWRANLRTTIGAESAEAAILTLEPAY